MNDGLINPQTKQNDKEIVPKAPDREIVPRPKKDSEILPRTKPSQPKEKDLLND